jgi:hypothetical protein
LLGHLEQLTPGNRALALDALVKTPTRAFMLLEALENGRVAPATLSKGQREALLKSQDENVRTRAAKIYAEP